MEDDKSKIKKQEGVVYSSKDILSNAAKRNRSFFGRVKTEKPSLAARIRDLFSKAKAKIQNNRLPNRRIDKRKVILGLGAIAAGIVIGVFVFLLLTPNNDENLVNDVGDAGDSYEETDDEEDAQIGSPYQYSWSEKLAELESEARALISNGDEASLQKAWELYENYLSGLSDPLGENQTEYLDVLLSYVGTVLNTIGDSDKAQEILSRIDIDSYTCPSSYTYISQKAQYYGYYQSIYESLGNTELANEYSQKIEDVLGEADYESGDGDGEQEETSDEE